MMSKRRKSLIAILIALLVVLPVVWIVGCSTTHDTLYRTYHSELEYLKAVNSAGPAGDPQIIFLLMAQYLNANQTEAGIEFFTFFLEKYEAELPPWQRSLYLSALALLRASRANQVALFERIKWVDETIELLETAKKLSDNEIFVVRWIAGSVYARLPERFNKKDAAREELKWCMENISKAPDPGWLREVYFNLALLHHQDKDDNQARQYLRLSGYDSFDKKITLVTPYSVNAKKGLTFYRRRLEEIIPGKIFALSGFEFTEYYFIVSHDQKELIAIDVGTTPESAQTVYEFLKNKYPNLPPLTTVFVTHAHWDHIGGHRFFRQLNSNVKFYSRENYKEELDKSLNAPPNFSYFFGTDFKRELIADFKPDETVAEPKEIAIGGTRFELIPISGGETTDAMFIHLPEHSVLFVGDFIMPYFGAPFLEEGNIAGLYQAIDVVSELNPRVLLHGHEPLTRIFDSPELLFHLKANLMWLEKEVLNAIRKGMDREAIQHQNLIPPSVFKSPDVQLPYLIMRENFINRVYDQKVGYWQTDLKGMDHLSQGELGSMFVHYLELSEKQLAAAVDKILKSGDYELAARLVTWSLTQYPASETLAKQKENAFVRLKEKYQAFNPFKFIIYSEVIKDETPQLE